MNKKYEISYVHVGGLRKNFSDLRNVIVREAVENIYASSSDEAIARLVKDCSKQDIAIYVKRVTSIVESRETNFTNTY